MPLVTEKEESLFQVGDKVVYPHHGAAIIKGLEEKEVYGQ
ncbi:MAG TPA: CarD family transcriptional regulator, partial [Actinomycetota bacterium]